MPKMVDYITSPSMLFLTVLWSKLPNVLSRPHHPTSHPATNILGGTETKSRIERLQNWNACEQNSRCPFNSENFTMKMRAKNFIAIWDGGQRSLKNSASRTYTMVVDLPYETAASLSSNQKQRKRYAAMRELFATFTYHESALIHLTLSAQNSISHLLINETHSSHCSPALATTTEWD